MYKLNYLQQNSPEKHIFNRWRRLNSYDSDVSSFFYMNQYLNLLYNNWYKIYNEY